MRQGCNPTLLQKIKLKSLKLSPLSWLVVQDDQKVFVVEHRISGATRTLTKAI